LLQEETCDYGKHRNFVVPPESVVVKPVRGLKKRAISEVILPPLENLHPLIVVGNNKSGSSDCVNLLAAFRDTTQDSAWDSDQEFLS